MRTLYVNEAALSQWASRTHPWANPDLIDHALTTMIDTVVQEWNITHTGGLEGTDAYLLTDLDSAPEDADFVACARVVLTPGPSLFQSSRIQPKEVQGIPYERHHLYRWALGYVSDRDAKMFARNGLILSIASSNREVLVNAIENDPPVLRTPPTPQSQAFITTSPDNTYRLVSPATEDQALADLARAVRLGFDTETYPVPGWDANDDTPFRKRWDEAVGLSFSTQPGTGWYLDARLVNNAIVTPTPRALLAFQRAMEDSRLVKVGHNVRYDLMMLRHTFGIESRGLIHDTMVQAYLLGKYKGQLGLKTRSWEDLGEKMIEFTELLNGRQSIADVPAAEVAPYAAADADKPLKLHDFNRVEMTTRDLAQAYQLECDLLWVLHEMEWEGMYVDKAKLIALDAQFKDEMKQLEQRLVQMAGYDFNPNSPPQLAKVMYEVLNYPRLDPMNRNSTNKDVIYGLLMQHPNDEFLMTKLRWSSVKTLRQNFTTALQTKINPRTGRIHANWHNTVAETNRLSCSGPNLMNIPSRSALGQQIRECFVGEDDSHLMVYDKSQIEPRIMAWMANDEKLKTIFSNDTMDLYREIAAGIFKVSPSEVSKHQRQQTKVTWLAVSYDAKDFTVSKRSVDPLADPPFMIDIPTAGTLIKSLFRVAPGLPHYMEGAKAFAREHGYAVTPYGNRRYVPDITSFDLSKQGSAERQAINQPIQGFAANLIKQCMVNLWKAGILTRFSVHDELGFEGPLDYLQAIQPTVIDIMTSVAPMMDVPVKVEGGIGKSWQQAKG